MRGKGRKCSINGTSELKYEMVICYLLPGTNMMESLNIQNLDFPLGPSFKNSCPNGFLQFPQRTYKEVSWYEAFTTGKID